MELGPRDMEKEEFVSVVRDTGKKSSHPLKGAVGTIKGLLDTMQQRMLDRYCACLNK